MALVPYSGGSGTAMATSVPLLTGENFTTWAIKVEADLDAAGLWEAVVPPEDAALAVIAKKDKPSISSLQMSEKLGAAMTPLYWGGAGSANGRLLGTSCSSLEK
ncbi:retrotransposon protein [Hordeum vulgare]|nr:retrotransposon protein [Hordeum vulgare]